MSFFLGSDRIIDLDELDDSRAERYHRFYGFEPSCSEVEYFEYPVYRHLSRNLHSCNECPSAWGINSSFFRARLSPPNRLYRIPAVFIHSGNVARRLSILSRAAPRHSSWHTDYMV